MHPARHLNGMTTGVHTRLTNTIGKCTCAWLRCSGIVMAQRCVAKPAKPHQALRRGEHICGYAALPTAKSMNQQVRLQPCTPYVSLQTLGITIELVAGRPAGR